MLTDGIGRALVEHHDHVGIEMVLDRYGAFRGQLHQVAVDGRTEFHPVLFDSAQGLEAPHLESAGVRQHRPVPSHELVKAAVGANDLRAGPEHQVKGIAEDDLAARGK